MKRPDQQVLHARGDLRPGEVRRAGGPGAPQGLGFRPVEQQVAHGVGDRTRVRGIDEQPVSPSTTASRAPATLPATTGSECAPASR